VTLYTFTVRDLLHSVAWYDIVTSNEQFVPQWTIVFGEKYSNLSIDNEQCEHNNNGTIQLIYQIVREQELAKIY